MPTTKDFMLAPVNRTLTADGRRHFYRQMMRIRAFEEVALSCYQAGHMGGFLIVQRGQESIPVAVRSLMEPQDHSLCGLREVSVRSLKHKCGWLALQRQVGAVLKENTTNHPT